MPAEPDKPAEPSMPAEPAAEPARSCEECGKKYRLKRPDVAGHYALTYCRACRTRVRTRNRLRAARKALKTAEPKAAIAEAKPDQPEEDKSMATTTTHDRGSTTLAITMPGRGPTAIQLERVRVKLLEAELADARVRLGEKPGADPVDLIREARELTEQLIKGAA